jgi:hypothetical protein
VSSTNEDMPLSRGGKLTMKTGITTVGFDADDTLWLINLPD